MLLTLASALLIAQTSASDIFLLKVNEYLASDNNPALTSISDSTKMQGGYTYCNALDDGTSLKDLNQLAIASAHEKFNQHAQQEKYFVDYLAVMTVNAVVYLCPAHKQELEDYLNNK